ncbi:MAG TPA: metal-sulfur cluster assembly factor [Rhodocyclaceae bacterium]|jgi:metal-sulfur cluster biosynthetic enzyme|nr:metal-sulfur cluster assembly factor [Rhodocyclaceae bacterium]
MTNTDKEKTQTNSPDEITESLRLRLKQVIDPEVGMNIIDLGLIYRVEMAGLAVCVDMTMTSPACPMGDILLEDVEKALQAGLPEGYTLNLQLVWEPIWSPDMMSEDARAHFNWED